MLGTLCPRIAKRASLLSSPFFAVIICSNMLALSRKSLGSTTVEPLPLSSMASASAFASVTRLMRSAPARSCAAAMVRCAALIWFMESSTSRGRPILVMRVETSWKP